MQTLEKELDKWKRYRRALRMDERKIFDKVIDDCRSHNNACSRIENLDVFESMLLSVLLEQRKEIIGLKKKIKELNLE